MDNQLLVTGNAGLIPAQIAAAGDTAAKRFVEFFTANIRNPNTRGAYARAIAQFFRWCETRGLRELGRLEPVHVAAYVEHLGKTHAAPSVKQHLAAVRMLFDWLVVGQVVRSNPASVVRGPRHVVNRGRTPILSPDVREHPDQQPGRSARSRAHRRFDLQLRPDQRGAGDAG